MLGVFLALPKLDFCSSDLYFRNMNFVALVLVAILAAKLVQAQVVQLTHPETHRFPLTYRGSNSDQQGPQQVSIAQRGPSQTRFVAKPGNVIVHFDKSHEIQQLQYVLQDGRLANLYQRHPEHPDNVRLPIQVSPASGLQRRDEQPKVVVTGPAPQDSIMVNQNSTIEILDSKLQTVSHLIGDHLTLTLPPQLLVSNGTDHQHMHIDAHDLSEDEKLEILATIAKEALQAGTEAGEAKLKKLTPMMDKLKAKVSQKLHELPGFIESKIRAKSSAGKVLLSHTGDKIQVVEESDVESQQAQQQFNKESASVQAAPTQPLSPQPQALPPQPLSQASAPALAATAPQILPVPANMDPRQVVVLATSEHEYPMSRHQLVEAI